MKILISPHGTHGDLKPLIALGIELEKRDHEVTFSGNFADTPLIEKLGFKNIAANFNIDDDIIEFKKKKSFKNRIEILINGLDHHASSLFEIAKDFDLLIGNTHQLLGSTIAEYHKIPYFHVIHSPGVLPSGYHPPLEISNTNLPKFINKILWKNYRRIHNKYTLPYINNVRREKGLSPFNSIDDIYKHSMILSVNKTLSPMPDDVGFSVPHTDYWHLFEKEKLDEDLVTFIKSGVSPVYIGFSNVPDNIKDCFKNVVKDLLSRTQLRFILCSGLAGLDFEDNSKVYVVNEVPHSRLFPEMSLVVHHGGAGTTNTALISGIPQIIVPHMGDQFYFAKRISQLGIGSKVSNLNKIEVELPRRIIEILSSRIYREKAQFLVNSATPRGGVRETATIIEKVIGKARVYN